MGELSDGKLKQLLREAYPAVELSPDFTLRLWRKLMKEPLPTFWRVPAGALAAALALGVGAGLWSWSEGRVGAAGTPVASVVASAERLDLFGNAPFDSLAGAYLRRMQGGKSA